MGSEWKIARLGDHVEACLGKMLDQNKTKELFTHTSVISRFVGAALSSKISQR